MPISSLRILGEMLETIATLAKSRTAGKVLWVISDTVPRPFASTEPPPPLSACAGQIYSPNPAGPVILFIRKRE